MIQTKVSVIIPTYNRCESLIDTINSFQNQSYLKDSYEIIIVDNNSTDNTRKIVEKLINDSSTDITYIFEKRQGVHYARNNAAKKAKYDILYFTDDDIIADPNILEEIVKPFKYPDVATAGGRVYPKWAHTPPDWILKYFNNYWLSLLDYGNEPKILTRPEIDSCHQAIRKDLLIELGGFHPENVAGTWIGDGESGLLKEMLKMGYKICYVPSSIVWHVIPENRLTLNYIKKRAMNEGACSEFTAYRNNKFGNIGLLGRACVFTVLRLIYNILTVNMKIIRNDRFYLYESKASYYKSKCQYNLKLIHDEKLRDLVLKDGWMD